MLGAAGLSFGNSSFRGIDTQFEVPRSEKKWSSDLAIPRSAFDPGIASHESTLTLPFVSVCNLLCTPIKCVSITTQLCKPYHHVCTLVIAKTERKEGE